jgi:hypothetical protein
VPLFKNFTSVGLARNLKVFLRLEAGVVRGEIPGTGLTRTGERTRDCVSPENIVWIFSSGRSGTTWLRDMMSDLRGYSAWEEPLVGRLFGNFYAEGGPGRRKSGNYILGEQYREAWLGAIRKMVLDGAAARFPERVSGGYVVVKEPNGSMGAPLLSAALPESRIITLVRDPRDVCASSFDAKKEGGWQHAKRSDAAWSQQGKAEKEPEKFIKTLATNSMKNVSGAVDAYRAHKGSKVLVKYEDLISDTPGVMRRIYEELQLPVDDKELARVIERRSWENIPEKKRGEGKFYRKGTSGGWKQDLTPRQVEIVEQVTAPILKEFYGV